MSYKVKVYALVEPEEDEIFNDKAAADAEALQINLMQPEGCENLAVVVECDEEGNLPPRVKPPKLPPIITNGKAWSKKVIETALSYCPSINACEGCGYPVIDGYCCQYCGAINPSEINDPWGTGAKGRGGRYF